MISITVGDEWLPIIGDPTIMGWLTVVAYFVAAFLCWRVALLTRRGFPPGSIPSRTIFWLLFAGFLVFLGINKQLDLQTWMTVLGKRLAKSEGWYGHRRPVQVVFIGTVFLAGIAGLALLLWLSYGSWRRYGLALAGGVFLACFILIRAASFHHVDLFLGARVVGVKMNWILELGGIGAIALSAIQNLQSLAPGHNSKPQHGAVQSRASSR